MVLKNCQLSVLFVCMGNICRSPTAEGIFRHFAIQHLSVLDLEIDSAGTTGYHQGEKADPRAISAAKKRGYNLDSIVSRQVVDEDFEKFDLILAMDKDNFSHLMKHAEQSNNQHNRHKIKLFLQDFAPLSEYIEVPDPYYGADRGFDLVIDLIEQASQGLIKHIQAEYLSKQNT
ncbi:low molecular weight protein-tyrosine-phosphatase [Aliikangiella maris]|uniref:Low molecular weight protein-tyrosine-phosphatase n=2 Tax=Aliikangiella maris TaxID=3162458 RepID=A0ABV3MKV5_9GAMM